MRLLWIAAGVLLIDQVTKVAIRLTMAAAPYRSIPLLGDWLKLTYTENPGMAFGITFGPKGLVTAFSIIATMLIIVYLYRVRKSYKPYRLSLAVILGGAVGNIIDRLFYGMIFDYGPFFQGRVVDFIHFDIWTGFVPEGVPLIGGMHMALFPIFNVADIAIVGGVIGILVFQKKFHEQLLAESAAATASSPGTTASTPESAASAPETTASLADADLGVNGTAPPEAMPDPETPPAASSEATEEKSPE